MFITRFYEKDGVLRIEITMGHGAAQQVVDRKATDDDKTLYGKAWSAFEGDNAPEPQEKPPAPVKAKKQPKRAPKRKK